ncbi:MAG: glycosyl hydrolase [Verrucomicrobiales bacterium]
MNHPYTRRTILRSLAAAPLGLALPVEAVDAPKTRKKGFAGWDNDSRLALKVSWYYNWGPDGAPHDGIEFIPMVKGKGRMDETFLDRARAHRARDVKNLLGYNEPERAEQGNLTVEEAIEAWPKLTGLGFRVGSPAPSSDTKGMDWLDAFMKEAGKKKLQVDFIALHWYRSADPSAFESWLKDVYRAYRKPIWVTEFNPWRGHDEKVHWDFLRGALRALEKNTFVERYAYFNPRDEGNLFASSPENTADDSGPKPLTKLGVLYRDIDQKK